MAWLYRFDSFLWRQGQPLDDRSRLPGLGAPVELAGPLDYLARLAGQDQAGIWDLIRDTVTPAETSPLRTVGDKPPVLFACWPGAEDLLSIAVGERCDGRTGLARLLDRMAAEPPDWDPDLPPARTSFVLAAGGADVAPLRAALQTLWLGAGSPLDESGPSDMDWEVGRIFAGGRSLSLLASWSEFELTGSLELQVSREVVNGVFYAEALVAKCEHYEQLLRRELLSPPEMRHRAAMGLDQMASNHAAAMTSLQRIEEHFRKGGLTTAAAWVRSQPRPEVGDLRDEARRIRERSVGATPQDRRRWEQAIAQLRDRGNPLRSRAESVLRALSGPPDELDQRAVGLAELALMLVHYIAIAARRSAGNVSGPEKLLWKKLARSLVEVPGPSGTLQVPDSAGVGLSDVTRAAFAGVLEGVPQPWGAALQGFWVRTAQTAFEIQRRRNSEAHLRTVLAGAFPLGEVVQPTSGGGESTWELALRLVEDELWTRLGVEGTVVALDPGRPSLELSPYLLVPTGRPALLLRGDVDCLQYIDLGRGHGLTRVNRDSEPVQAERVRGNRSAP